VSTGTVLRLALANSNQHVRFVLLDILWRFIWGFLSAAMATFFVFSVFAQLGSMQWQGPELGASNPIILLAALRQLWKEFGPTFLGEFGILLLCSLGLWLVLEALFRGGRKGFWIYLGTAASRLALIGGSSLLFLALSSWDKSGGTVVIGAVVLVALVFLVVVLETAVRRDALELVAADLIKLAAVLGALLVAEGFLAFVLWGAVIAALMAASSSGAATIALLMTLFVAGLWMVLHSYLVAVRFSATDIMRRNVVGK